GRPEHAGISVELIQSLGKEIPILGICLGHQAVAVAYEGQVIRAPAILHGKTSQILHNGNVLFRKIPNPFEATRYHSLIVDNKNLPGCLQVTAETEDRVIMALQHTQYPVQGVQFHPESIVTEHGMQLIKNFIEE
ncbi:MAG TPA: aminodeoxychorismate/anthranilate synthase component II, partial [bacterium]|nr:aminodeoxychorismate/anthranilate synthase component II [bacterium]